MPFYEYELKENEKGCSYCKNGFEISASILSDDLKKCPECKAKIKKKVSLIAGSIIKGRQMNQFNDVKYAKYWRDNNGIRHKVTPADGSSTSPTVPTRVTASPEQVEMRKKVDKMRGKKTQNARMRKLRMDRRRQAKK